MDRRIGRVKMEEQNYSTFLDPIIQLFQEFFYHFSTSDEMSFISGSIETIEVEMRFFKMFLWGLAYWDIELEYDWHLLSAINVMFPKLIQTTKEFFQDFEYVVSQDQWINWDELSCDLKKIIKELKVQAKEICIHLLNGGSKCKSYPSNQMKPVITCARDTLFFMNFIQQNLETSMDFIKKNPKDFPNSNINLIIDLVRQQFGFIQFKLEEFGHFDNPIDHSITRVKNLGGLISCTRTWVNKISCLVFLYWIDGMNESQESPMKFMVSDLGDKIMGYTPGVVASNIEPTVVPQFIASYTDFLLKILVERPMTYEIETFCQGLIFLLSFVMHPPEENSMDKERILARSYAIINESLSCFLSIHSDEIKQGICEDKIFYCLYKIDCVKVEVEDIYVMSSVHSSNFTSPRTNPIGFLDALLETLKKMLGAGQVINLTPFKRHQVETIREDLASIRPFLQNYMESEKEHHGELKDLWVRTIDMVYYTSYVTNLFSGSIFPMWYTILCLPNVVKEIKLIKTQIKNIEDHLQILEKRRLNVETKSNVALAPQATTSKFEGIFIGFQEDVTSIIGDLVRGQEELRIISISGMPGQGKTTLAKKIFNDPSVQHHFHKKVWSYVSKECKLRELLLKIASDIIGHIDCESLPEIQQLLRRSLKGQRYLIVLDDIWDADVWHQVQVSFPNDRTGSRILFTSRNHNVASQAKSNSISYPLRLLSDEESWELMEKKVFQRDSCLPPELLEIGKRIAICCKGLPLAVSLIAAVLMRIERKVDSWIHLAETLKSYLASEGCWNIIELSYQNLPDHLKPCFLYFGVFRRGENILAKKLKLLWIGEGFINNDNDKMQSLEGLANGYLSDLVSQSLVVVTEKSAMGGIKKCNVHDLVYDLCLEKAEENNFLHWAEEESTVIDGSGSKKFSHHRLCIGKTDPLIKPGPVITREKLLTSQVHSLLLWVSQSFDIYLDHWNEFFENFKVLKLLDLKYDNVFKFCDMDDQGVMRALDVSIQSNIHLRYLALDCYTSPRWQLPIANLWNLEILIIKTDCISVPMSILTIKSLRHVKVQDWDWADFDDGENNSSFEAYDIEELGRICLTYNSQAEEFLKKLQKLRKLSCLVPGARFYPMWFSMLSSFTNLESLYFEGIGEHPSTINFPKIENLKKLTLNRAGLPWSMLSEIGKQLPNLRVLKLLHDPYLGSIWGLEDDSFSMLVYLKLHGLKIEKINFSLCDDPFPCLEQLVVSDCYELEEIPSNFGDICTLNIIKCNGSNGPDSSKFKRSVQKVLKKQRENENHGFRVIGIICEDEDEDDICDDEDDKEEEGADMGEI